MCAIPATHFQSKLKWEWTRKQILFFAHFNKRDCQEYNFFLKTVDLKYGVKNKILAEGLC